MEAIIRESSAETARKENSNVKADQPQGKPLRKDHACADGIGRTIDLMIEQFEFLIDKPAEPAPRRL